MRVLLSTYDSRGGVEPLAGLAVRLRALGTEVVRVYAPSDCAERLAEAGVPLVPVGPPATATGPTSGGALPVMATRFVTPVQAPCCAAWLPATSDRS
jgi:hypothetical protein